MLQQFHYFTVVIVDIGTLQHWPILPITCMLRATFYTCTSFNCDLALASQRTASDAVFWVQSETF